MKHGLLSSEVVIVRGEGREDIGLYEALCDHMRTDFGPVGVIEELLVDKLIELSWRWRRVLRYETAAIREISDASTEDWAQQEGDVSILSLASGPWRDTEDIEGTVRMLKAELAYAAYSSRA